jgi:hypothetical protein
MQRWTNAEPLVLPIRFGDIQRLDLEFVNVRRDNGSFTAFVYVNAGELAVQDAGRDNERFAGSFSIFAPTYCWGVDDHCDWSKGPVSPFDRRPPHHLTPINVSMEITDTIRKLGNPDELTVTVHAARRDDPDAEDGVLRFERLTALAYQ